MANVIPAAPATRRPPGGPSSTRRSASPVGKAFTAYTAVILVVFAVVITGDRLSIALEARTVSHLGVVASTVFVLAGLLAGYRAVTARDRKAGLIAAVLLGPGAGWCWLAFVDASPLAGRVSGPVAVVANGLAIVLLVEGLRLAHWFGVFSGLGSLALGLTAIGFDSTAGSEAGTGLLALLAGVAGMTCLYGLLVDVELTDQRSLLELIDSKDRIEHEMARTEEVLHDLRNGLLSIEAAIGCFDEDLAGPLQAEAARLRRLTLRGVRRPVAFDVVAVVRDLVATRRAAGADIELRAPVSAMAWGEASEVLTIVDNLIANAERHGRKAPIVVEIDHDTGATRLSVINRGRLGLEGDGLFRRGFTTHPEGRGLGLSRSKMLARMNGAELTVAPSGHDHTTFVVRLAAGPPGIEA